MELLERETFLDALDEYAAAAAAGSGRVVLLHGEAGIGKTALVEAFRDRRPELGWLWGGCDASFTPRPLAPVYEIAAQAGGPLARAVDGAADATADRSRLFAASLEALRTAVPKPAVVVVEDLHWADEATLDWVAYLARRVARVPALLLLTYRATEVAVDPVLASALGRIAAHGVCRRMLLPPLSASAVRSLADRHQIDGGHLLRVTGGNPFYVGEVVASRGEEVPASVSDVVRARVLRHSPAARRMLAAAAVLGRPGSASLLAGIAGVEAVAVDECVASGTLLVVDGRFAFAHELTRLAVEHHLPAFQAEELHRAALVLLERSGAPHAELAHHAVLARDPVATFEHARAAADEAARAAAHREALRHVEAARSAADDLGADDLVHADLLDQLTRLLGLTDQWQEASEHNAKALAVRRAHDDLAALCETLRMRVLCLWRLGRHDECRRSSAEHLALTAQLPDTEARAWALAYHGCVAADAAPDDRLAALDEAVRIGRARDVPDVVVHALLTKVGLLAARGGDLGPAHEALLLARDAGLHSMAGRAYVELGMQHALRFSLDEATALVTEGVGWCDEHDLPVWAAELEAIRALVLLRRGQLAAALRHADQLLAHGSSPYTAALARACRLWAGVRSGGVRSVGPVHEERIASAEIADPIVRIPPATALAELAWLHDDPALVDEPVRRACADAVGSATWLGSELAVALHRLGFTAALPETPPAPYALELAGDHRGAAAAWRERGCPYEAAVALAGSPAAGDLAEALAVFTELGAAPAAAKVRRMLRAAGVRTVPRGPRATTQAHPLGLTAREAQVLALLAEGLTNASIAERLVLSTRTVDHHVSAVLAKLGVGSREEAALRAGDPAGAT